jgi:hypothetical protein
MLQMIFLWLLGCGGINSEEAELIFSALYEPLSDIRDNAIESTEEEISISLSLGEDWEGEVTATGIKAIDELTVVYPLTVNLTDVYVAKSHLTLNGDLSFGVAYFLDPTDAASFEKTATVDGELIVDAPINGTADLAYKFIEAFDSQKGNLEFSASGTISDIDVGQFTTGISD